jgi:hypothetical protein
LGTKLHQLRAISCKHLLFFAKPQEFGERQGAAKQDPASLKIATNLGDIPPYFVGKARLGRHPLGEREGEGERESDVLPDRPKEC